MSRVQPLEVVNIHDKVEILTSKKVMRISNCGDS